MTVLICLKPGCGNFVKTEDTYCKECEVIKKSIAEQLDAKFNTVGQQPSSALAAYDMARGSKAFPSAGALGFPGMK